MSFSCLSSVPRQLIRHDGRWPQLPRASSCQCNDSLRDHLFASVKRPGMVLMSPNRVIGLPRNQVLLPKQCSIFFPLCLPGLREGVGLSCFTEMENCSRRVGQETTSGYCCQKKGQVMRGGRWGGLLRATPSSSHHEHLRYKNEKYVFFRKEKSFTLKWAE